MVSRSQIDVGVDFSEQIGEDGGDAEEIFRTADQLQIFARNQQRPPVKDIEGPQSRENPSRRAFGSAAIKPAVSLFFLLEGCVNAVFANFDQMDKLIGFFC